MSTRRPSYSTPSTTGSFSAAQWPAHSYGSSYSPPPPHNPYPSSYAPPQVGQSMYTDIGMHNSSAGVPLQSEPYSYVSTPRSALGGSGSAGRQSSSFTDAYYPASEPIAISRPSPTSSSSYSSHHHHHSHNQQHPHQHPYITTSSPPSSHAQGFAPGTSPQSPSSPQSPVSQLSSFAYVPASPQRPFACDMCALSFSRQHDLKRHRDTHSGEKPFFCNGGCGKQFTRKDALKRHQLVKRCGTEDA